MRFVTLAALLVLAFLMLRNVFCSAAPPQLGKVLQFPGGNIA